MHLTSRVACLGIAAFVTACASDAGDEPPIATSAHQSALTAPAAKHLDLGDEGTWLVLRTTTELGTIETDVFDPSGSRVPLTQLQRARERAQRRRVLEGGAMTGRLRTHLSETGDRELIPVIGWMALPALIGGRDPLPHIGDSDADIDAHLTATHSLLETFLETRESLDRPNRSPLVVGEVTPATIDAMGRSGLFMRLEHGSRPA